jgi:hypothetical protein
MHSLDPGDLGAWQLRGSVYLQALAPSGREEIFRMATGGKITALPVPHVAKDNAIVGTHGSRLLVNALDHCTQHETLLWFNPATGREQLLINTKPALAGVLGALAYGQPVADIFIQTGCAKEFRRTVRI